MSSKRAIQRAQKDIVNTALAKNDKVLTLKVQDALEGSREYQALLKEEREVRAEQHNNNLNITKKSSALEARRQLVKELELAVAEHTARKPIIEEKHRDVLSRIEQARQQIETSVRDESIRQIAEMIGGSGSNSHHESGMASVA